MWEQAYGNIFRQNCLLAVYLQCCLLHEGSFVQGPELRHILLWLLTPQAVAFILHPPSNFYLFLSPCYFTSVLKTSSVANNQSFPLEGGKLSLLQKKEDAEELSGRLVGRFVGILPFLSVAHPPVKCERETGALAGRLLQ